MTEIAKTGWAWVLGAKKWHYFSVDGRSLCRKYGVNKAYAIIGLHGQLEKGKDSNPDNCAECKRRKKRLDTGVKL